VRVIRIVVALVLLLVKSFIFIARPGRRLLLFESWVILSVIKVLFLDTAVKRAWLERVGDFFGLRSLILSLDLPPTRFDGHPW
jgi:hypothetical protein